MKMDSTDTIVAISTPPGENGISIVRLSGPSALSIADRCFSSKGDIRPSEFKSHTIHYGLIKKSGRTIDEVLLTVMRAPLTYTREDVVELNCHGGIVVVRETLELMILMGARIAEPGEFTKRAFLNGRIDLAQAEAVLDIITSKTEDSLRIAQRQLSGDISVRIKEARSKLITIIADIEAGINFPDDDLNVSREGSIKASLIDVEKALGALLHAPREGLILREGITTVICGRPNVGKSTLMNCLLNENRAIVTPFPGTTRDSIEEIVNLRGIPLKIVDTAGIMQAHDEPAREGVKRSLHCISGADLVLLVLDSSAELNSQDLEIIDIVKDKKALVVINKTDLPEVLRADEIKRHLYDKNVIRISAKNRSGLDKLRSAIYDMFWSGQVSSEDILLSNARHIEAVRNALNFIKDAVSGTEEERPWEFLAVDIKDAAEALGVVTGESFTEDLLQNIFSRFCIGK